jgi:hypothetical protein
MLIKKIQDHNYLNGYLFVTIEFGLFVSVVFPFTIYYLLSGKTTLAIIGLGLIINFTTMALFSARSMLRKENSLGIHKLYNKKKRNEIRLNYPTLTKDTTILFLTLLVPFMLTIIVCIELLTSRQNLR